MNCKVIVYDNGVRIIYGKIVLHYVNNNRLFLFQGQLSHIEAHARCKCLMQRKYMASAIRTSK